MSIQSLSNPILLSQFKTLVQQERKVSRQVLEYIAEIEKRRLYADEGFTSTHDYLVSRHGYSHASAGRRVSAAKLLNAVPEASAKIETGVLCMSTLSRVQSAIRFEEKRMGSKMTPAKKIEVIQQIEAKPKAQIEQSLADIFQTVAPQKEIVQAKFNNETRAHLTFTGEQMKRIERAAELLSHKIHDQSLASVIAEMAEVVIATKDPLAKIVRPRASKNNKSQEPSKTESLGGRNHNAKQDRCGVIPPSIRNFVFRRDNGCCQFETRDGRKCLSRRLAQVDHIVARALGGSDDPANLRVLCRTHNLLMAERVFGREKMAEFRV